MSEFKVTIERISTIYPHPNADRLEIGELEGIGYKFCIPKDEYVVGENVVYFPIDSVLPEKLIEKLGLTGKLAGSKHDRVKTIRLRGEISQGIIANMDIISLSFLLAKEIHNEPILGSDVTELLGVAKYEAFVEVGNQGNKGNLPSFLSHYDIENAEKFGHFANALMNEPVYISEKLEGQQTNLVMYKDGSIKVASRNFERELSPENNWGAGWINSGILEKLNEIFGFFIFEYAGTEIESLGLRGEVVGNGIQGNIYKFPDRKIFLFEIEINGEPIDASDFLKVCDMFKLPQVPCLIKGMNLGWALNYSNLPDFSNRKSVLFDTQAEGIVIKPMQEMVWDNYKKEAFYRDELDESETKNLQRLFLKQRSPLYLAKEKD